MIGPRDVRASLSYMTKGDLSRTGNELVNGEKVPGWYVRAYKNEGYTDIFKYTRIPDEAARRLAIAFENEIVPKGDTFRPLSALVQTINTEQDREKRDRLKALPAEIARLEREEIRLRAELASGGER